jgi:hypothetical protein
MDKEEFEKDLEIDIENLDVEATLQPELYFKYSVLTKEARERYDLYKMKLSITEAELSKRARLKPKAFGITKVTEGSIKEAVTIHPEHRSAYKKMIKAKNESELLYRAQEAMEQRKRMLELLVQLHGREYFAGPSIPHTPEHFRKYVKRKKGEKADAEMKKRVKKRKRGNSA